MALNTCLGTVGFSLSDRRRCFVLGNLGIEEDGRGLRVSQAADDMSSYCTAPIAPLGESAGAAQSAVASGVSRLETRGLGAERADAIGRVAQCTVRTQDNIDTCIQKHQAEKYRLSAKEVKARVVRLCIGTKGDVMGGQCVKYANEIFKGDDRRHPTRLQRFARIIDHRVKATGRAVVRGAKRISSGGRAVAKSVFNRPSAFQNSVREKEGVGALHPIGSIRVPE
ncbi:MAG: hypothetical protein M1826_001821 [Phylliscum demangeonii]|nr:MAG: hypothetical protein M1826_001821 [Phylliscum demangeonii]